MPPALSWKEPTEHRIVIEGAGEHLTGLRRVSTPGHPYLKTSHPHQPRPLPDSTARLRSEGPTPGRLREFRINRAPSSEIRALSPALIHARMKRQARHCAGFWHGQAIP